MATGAESVRSDTSGGAGRTGEDKGMFSRAIRRDVIMLLCLKAVVLTVLYVLFFSHKPAVTPAAVQQQLTQPRQEQ